MVLVDFYSTGNVTCFLYLFELMFPIFTYLIFVASGDSSGISVTGETPQERGFRDEEAHRTPHGKRPLATKISVDQDLISPTSLYCTTESIRVSLTRNRCLNEPPQKKSPIS